MTIYDEEYFRYEYNEHPWASEYGFSSDPTSSNLNYIHSIRPRLAKLLEESAPPEYLVERYIHNFESPLSVDELLTGKYTPKFKSALSKVGYLVLPDSGYLSAWYPLMTYFVETSQFQKFKDMTDIVMKDRKDIVPWELLLIVTAKFATDFRFFKYSLLGYLCYFVNGELPYPTLIDRRILLSIKNPEIRDILEWLKKHEMINYQGSRFLISPSDFVGTVCEEAEKLLI